MSRKQKIELIRIAAAALLLAVVAFLPLQGVWQLCAFLLPYGLIGWDIIRKAIRNIVRGQVFDENFLMALATVGAFATGEYAEAVFVMLFYQVGEWFQRYAVGKSRRSIAALMDIRPEYANIERDGSLVQVDPSDVAVGEIITVQPGEKIPLDGIVFNGTSSLSTVAITGESLPREVGTGDEVLSGCINGGGVLQIQTTKAYEDSTVARILELVENASAHKAKTEAFITRFSKYYTPCVVVAAAALAILPPLLGAGGWSQWIHRALIFLVVSCPCALVISVPLSFFGGIGGASKSGILIKGANYMEALARTDTVVFDKTGTLTEGSFEVTAVHPEMVSKEKILELAAIVEQFSTHPIALSLCRAWKGEIPKDAVSNLQEQPGRGLLALVRGVPVYVGNEILMTENGFPAPGCHRTGTIIHVAAGKQYLGHIVISDRIKPESADAIAALKTGGVQKTVMLTGDRPAIAQAVATELALDEFHAGLLPGDKVEKVQQLSRIAHGSLVFVGDGINDAPVLASADVGIAMGGIGSDAAIEAADVVLMDDNPAKVAKAIALSRRTLSIVKQNIVFALGVKAAVLLLAALGYAFMWEAVFADVGVSVLAILNAMRALNNRE